MKNTTQTMDQPELPAANFATQNSQPAAVGRKGMLGRTPKWWGSASTPQDVPPPWERIMRIHQALESGTHPNASTLAADLGVSAKTIARDLAYMQSRLNLPIAYAAERFGYHYTQPVTVPSLASVSEADLFALLLAERAISQYRGTVLELPLRSLFQKLLLALNQEPCFTVDNLRAAMSLPMPSADPAILQAFTARNVSA